MHPIVVLRPHATTTATCTYTLAKLTMRSTLRCSRHSDTIVKGALVQDAQQAIERG
jgi:hypothetical protein